MPISALPNAGLPSVVDGKMHYDLTPDALAEHLSSFVTELGVSVIGGCCGTTPEHLAKVVAACAGLEPARPLAGARAVGRLAVRGGAVRAGAVVPRHRRAHERQRLEALPRRHARRRLGDDGRHGARPGARRGAPARRLRRLHGRRRGQGHDGGGATLRHPVVDPARHRHHRGARRRGRPAVDRRAARAQLGQPRGRGRSRHEARPVPHPRPRLRRRCHLHVHRHRRSGAHGRLEAARRQGHPRPRRRALRPRAFRPAHRPPRPAAFDRHGGEPPGRHRDDRGDPADQGRAAGRAHGARPLERVVRARAGRPPAAQLRLPARVRAGRARRRHRARRQDPSLAQDRRTPTGRSASTSSTTGAGRATTRSRP